MKMRPTQPTEVRLVNGEKLTTSRWKWFGECVVAVGSFGDGEDEVTVAIPPSAIIAIVGVTEEGYPDVVKQ